MTNPFRYRSPDARLRDIAYARDRENERAARLEEEDAVRLDTVQRDLQREQQRAAALQEHETVRLSDTAKAMEHEQERAATLRRRTLEDVLRAGESPRAVMAEGEQIDVPRHGYTPLDVLEAADYPRQVVKEKIIEPVVPGFELPVKVSAPPPIPQLREGMGMGARAISAIAGRTEPLAIEQRIPEPRVEVTITDEMVEEAASWILDPLNALPVVGWGPDILRAARAGVPALKTVLKNPAARSFLDDAMRAGARGGPRPRLGGFEDIRPRPLEGGPPIEPPRVGRDIPEPVARTVEPEPVLGGFENLPPPGAPPPSITEGLVGEPRTPGGLLARFQDRLPGRPVQQADWAKYAGGLAEEGAEIEKVAMPRLNQAARRVPRIGSRLLSRTRNPHNEAMLKALHGEGPVPEGAQGFFDELQGFKALHEQRTIGDVPSFERRMLPQYYPRGWKNATEKIDEFRLGQALERGEISPEVFQQQHAKLVGTGKLGPGAKPGALRTRSLPLTFSEAIERGWVPLSWNPVDLMVLHAAELADYRYSMVLGELWKTEGRAIPRSAAPTAWKTPDYPAFTSKPFVTAEGKAAMSEPLVVSPEDFNLLENMLGARPTDVTDALAYVTSVFKRAKVALGLFQHVDLNYRLVVRGMTRGELEWMAAGPKAMAANFAPPLRPRLMRGLLNDPVIKEGVEEGLQLTGGLDVFKRDMRAALEPDLVVRAPVIGDLPLERLPGGIRQGAKKVQDVLNGIYGYMGKGLFDGAQPQYMGAFYKSIRKELLRAHPELTSRQIAALAAETSNNMMSNIPQWQSVLGPRLRQLGRATSFSVNEGEAWLRQGVKPFYKGAEPGVRGTYLRQWAGYMFGTLAIAEVINYGITGELLSPEQMQPIVMRNGRPTYNSRFARPRLDGDGPLGSKLGIKGAAIKDEDGNITGHRHIYLDLMGQADTPFRALNPQFFVMTRLSPQFSTGVQLLQGEKFFGQQPLGGSGDQAKFAAQQLVEPIPVSAFTQEQGRIGTTGAAIQAGGVNVSAEGLREVLAHTRAQVMQEKGIPGDYDTLKAADSPRATEIDNDPRVQAIFNEVQKSTAKMAPTPESQFFEQTELTREQQQANQLADDAKLNSGQWAGDVWRENYRDRQRDFFNRREQVKQDFQMEFEDKEAPSGSVNAAIAAYFDVNVDNYAQPDGETDWDGFFKARDAALGRLSSSDRARVMKFIRKYDTSTVREFRKAQDIVDKFYDMPKYVGLSLEDGEEVDHILLEIVPRMQTAQLRQGVELERGQAVMAAVSFVKDPDVAKFLLTNFGPRLSVRQRSKRRGRRAVSLEAPSVVNPERDDILLENQDILSLFYPDLLAKQLNREQEAGLGERAFATLQG